MTMRVRPASALSVAIGSCMPFAAPYSAAQIHSKAVVARHGSAVVHPTGLVWRPLVWPSSTALSKVELVVGSLVLLWQAMPAVGHRTARALVYRTLAVCLLVAEPSLSQPVTILPNPQLDWPSFEGCPTSNEIRLAVARHLCALNRA
jgi:hypothetical protein